MADSSETYSTIDAARILGVSVRTAQMWVEDGRLRAWKTPGGHRRILRESVEAMLQQRRAEAGEVADRFSVLLVEDDRIQRQILISQIGDALPGTEIHSAGNGMEGLIKLGEHQPQVLITDLVMPGIDGFRMLETLSTMPTFEPLLIIVTTSLTPDEVAANGRLPTGVTLFHKPLRTPPLLELVKGHFQQWSLSRAA